MQKICFVVVALSLGACAEEKQKQDHHNGDAQLTLRLERIKPGVTFKAIATLSDDTGAITGATVTITSTRGVALPVEELDDGVYSSTITPAGAGEYVIQASVADSSVERTALVLDEVGERWDQPQRVEGLVNTRGWEDGINVTPDGQWLFVQYVPVSPGCIWIGLLQCDEAIGPYSAPERPDFIGDERIASDGSVANACLGVDLRDDTRLPPCSYWAFRRQEDGSFAEPVRIGFEGSGGCLCPVGLLAHPEGDNEMLILFSWDDKRDVNTPGDVGNEFVWQRVDLSTAVNVGTWSGTFPTADIIGFAAEVIPIPHLPFELGVNLHATHIDGAITQIWFDREDHEGSAEGISVSTLQDGGAFPDGPWNTFVQVPVGPVDVRMPFFDGDVLTFRSEDSIASATFTGASASELGDASAWSTIIHELVPAIGSAAQMGSIFTLGEPTLATLPSGKTALYFNYGVLRPDGKYDLDVGFVESTE